MKHEVRVISSDPGTRNYGICHLSYWGHKFIKDEKGEWVKIPLFEILNWCLYDLKTAIVYHKSKTSASVVREKYESQNNNLPKDDLLHLGNSVSLFATNNEWLYQTYRSDLLSKGEEDILPSIVTELQCGQIKNHEIDVTLVSHLFPWCIKSVDREKGNHKRDVLSRAKKYGFNNDGSLNYKERKQKADDIARELLKMCGMTKELNFMNALKAARKRDIPHKPPQSHDISDSLLLGLEECGKQHADLMKSMDIVQEIEKEEIKQGSIEITINDDDDSDDGHNAFFSLTKRAKAVDKSFEKQDKKRKASTVTKQKKNEPVTKKRKKQLIDDEEEISDIEPVKKMKKKSTKKNTASDVKRYTQLAFMDDFF